MSATRGLRSALVNAAALVGSGLCATLGAQEFSATVPGMTYDTIEQLPDFGGWWLMEVRSGQSPFAQPPFLPEIAASFQEIVGKLTAGVDPVDLGTRSVYWYCEPSFAGINGGEDYFEILFTPGRVTIANENGLVRRIPLRDQPLPADLDESHSGTSVARWEGRTLVVETGGLNHDAPFIPGPLGIKIGRKARTVERISLADPDTLEIVVRMTAPELFISTHEITTRFQRDRMHVFREAGHCGDLDRSIDPVTGRVRFDMTPPADLPAAPR